MKSYEKDVFLSFTGADREWKNAIKERIDAAGLSYYDSDEDCNGQFRPDFTEALDKSRVYLMILTDNLRNDPNVTKRGTFTEVRREGNLAAQLEAAGELNIVILVLSEFFRFDTTFHDYHDAIGWHFYSLTRGFSEIFGEVNEDGTLSERTLSEVVSRCRHLVEKRLAGAPVPSQSPRIDIAAEGLPERGVFHGRERELEAAIDAFCGGARAVVLTGIGGIGKTTLATEIARRCEALSYLRCPQIVHIADGDEHRDPISALLSSVDYEARIYDSLSTLCESDRKKRKMAALASLPETVLLVIDNMNDLTADVIRTLTARLSCRLLFTTRAQVGEVPGAVTVTIDSLGEEEAYGMFREVLGAPLPAADFARLYRFVGGHTITLCIMARVMAEHAMDVDVLLEGMEGLSSFSARVGFTHNEYGDSDTVLGHLSRLFDMAGFDEGSCRILRSMALLGSDAISLADLTRVLSLPNRNEITPLLRGEWLEYRRQEIDGEVHEEVSLHPILARLAADLLRPDSRNAREMVAYLESEADAARESLTYADAARVSDRLFYACSVIAASEGALPEGLFSRFSDVGHLVASAADTAEKMRRLGARLPEGRERAKVIAYGDMVTLEQFPTRTDILERYIGKIAESADDYRFVLRALSVTVPHLFGAFGDGGDGRAVLCRAIDAAIAAAMRRRDDFALSDLAIHSILAHDSVGEGLRAFFPYLRRRRREAGKSSAFLHLQFMVVSNSIFRAKTREESMRQSFALLSEVADENYSSFLRLVLRHPILYLRSLGLAKKIKRQEEDAISRYDKAMLGQGELLATDGQLDARAMIEAAVEMHYMRICHHTTLAMAADAVRDVISFLNALPHAMVAGVAETADNLLEAEEMQELSPHALSVLQVSTLVNRAAHNKTALAQSKKLLDTVRRLRPEGHNDVIDAQLAYADLSCEFGNYEEAIRAYYEVLAHYRQVAPTSAKLSDVAYRLLSLRGVKFSLPLIVDLRRDALAGADRHKAGYYDILFAYFNCLRAAGAPREENYGTEILEALREGVEELSALSSLAQQSILLLLQKMAEEYFPTTAEWELILSLTATVAERSAYRRVRDRAYVGLRYLRFFRARMAKEPPERLVALEEETVRAALRRRSCHDFAYRAFTIRYIALSERDLLALLPERFVRSKRKREHLLFLLESYRTTYGISPFHAPNEVLTSFFATNEAATKTTLHALRPSLVAYCRKMAERRFDISAGEARRLRSVDAFHHAILVRLLTRGAQDLIPFSRA